ncbi:MAG: hypothetical protein D6712_16125 [Chloroflexi bacterium]|nr:MAG: hypothetical protein D6712_16125 [Chloroflexota bacterium]
MIARLQNLPRPLRLVAWLVFLGGGVLILIIITLMLVNNSPRNEGTSLLDYVTVEEYATLPDDNAYPATLTIASDGTLYTGSYVTGTVWRIPPAENGLGGEAIEIPSTRSNIGSVVGLYLRDDGKLLVLDRIDYEPGQGGGILWEVDNGGAVVLFAQFPDVADVSVNDITGDDAGNLYITDRSGDVIWRIESGSHEPQVWWTAPYVEGDKEAEISALAYDATNQALLVTDVGRDIIYRVPLSAAEPQSATDILYKYSGVDSEAPGLEGIDVAADGRIFVAALGVNKVYELVNGELSYIAENFRGVSDVVIGPDGRLYVTNWNQFSLLVGALTPRLPFGLDVITINAN